MIERTLTLSRRDGTLTIADVLDGVGTHRIRWHFHFAPEVEVTIAGGDRIEIQAGARALELSVAASLRPTLAPGWYSPSYGARRPCVCLDIESEQRLEGRHEYRFRIAPWTA